jgi:uncharacterized membrane protein YvbJ
MKDIRYCSYCGVEKHPKDNFCQNCGERYHDSNSISAQHATSNYTPYGQPKIHDSRVSVSGSYDVTPGLVSPNNPQKKVAINKQKIITAVFLMIVPTVSFLVIFASGWFF